MGATDAATLVAELAASGASPRKLIARFLEALGDDAAISFSGAEDVLLIEYAKDSGHPFRVFSLDTARLHP